MPIQFLPGTSELTVSQALLPPTVYFAALTLLPPFVHASKPTKRLITLIRSLLAVAAAGLFARLPLKYHVDHSAGLTYILALIGWYGATRVLDVFFITDHVPRRVQRKLKPVVEEGRHRPHGVPLSPPSTPFLTDDEAAPPPLSAQERVEASKFRQQTKWGAGRTAPIAPATDQNGPASRSAKAVADATASFFGVGRPRRGSLHIEKTRSEEHARLSWVGRLVYALDLETSMRGVGWCWTTADVRHTVKTWLPSVADEVEQVVFVDVPNVTGAWLATRLLSGMIDPVEGLSSLPGWARGFLTLAQGFFLFGTFSLGYHVAALGTFILGLRNPYRTYSSNNLAYFPPLNSAPLYEATSVRSFWSKSWHRLFSRFFLVWGVWPGQWVERHLLPNSLLKRVDPHCDAGKVLGAFFSSGIIHSAASITINGGDIWNTGEFAFFFSNGVAVVIEEAVARVYRKWVGRPDMRWYERAIAQLWTVTVLLTTGQWFTRGWVDSGLIQEMSLTPSQHLRLKAGIDLAAWFPIQA